MSKANKDGKHYRALISAAGLNQSTAATALGISTRTSRRYAAGEELPGPVVIALECLATHGRRPSAAQ